MAGRWFRNALAHRAGSARSGGLVLAVSWVASLVVVAGITVVLTYRLAGDHTIRPEGASTAAIPDAGSGQEKNARRDAEHMAAPMRGEAVHGPAHGGGTDPETQARTAERAMLAFEGAYGFSGIDTLLVSHGVRRWCGDLATLLDRVTRDGCLSDQFRDTGHRSVEGRPMIMRAVSATSQPPAGRVLLIAATHGDEPSSITTVFRWIDLMQERGTRYDWHVVPTLNPDGVFHDPATRVNANGVDLNRNLPTTGWNKQAHAYWRRVGFEKRRYPGKSAGSEPENRWLVEEVRKFRPNVIISLHAPYGVLDYDGNFPAPRKLGRLKLHRLGIYPGSLGNFGSRMRDIPVITVELDDARVPPSPDENQRMWHDLNGWLDRFFSNRVRQAQSSSRGAEAG